MPDRPQTATVSTMCSSTFGPAIRNRLWWYGQSGKWRYRFLRKISWVRRFATPEPAKLIRRRSTYWTGKLSGSNRINQKSGFSTSIWFWKNMHAFSRLRKHISNPGFLASIDLPASWFELRFSSPETLEESSFPRSKIKGDLKISVDFRSQVRPRSKLVIPGTIPPPKYPIESESPGDPACFSS